MKFGKASIEITAYLEPLKRALSKARSAVGKAAKGMGRLFSSAFSKSIVYARRALIGVAGALAYAAYNAGKQEAAEVKLAAAIEATGGNVQKLMKDYKQYAAAIQDKTAIGDEDTLQNMQLGLSMGVQSDKIKEATTMAIGLSKALEVDVATAMRYVGRALAGDYNALNRYVVGLQEAETANEKFALIQATAARGMQVAEAWTDTFQGSLAELKGRLDDVSEIIGKPIIDALKDMSKWVSGNNDTMVKWGETVAAEIQKAINWFTDVGKRIASAFKESGWSGLFEEGKNVGVKLGNQMATAFEVAFGNAIENIDWKRIAMKAVTGASSVLSPGGLSSGNYTGGATPVGDPYGPAMARDSMGNYHEIKFTGQSGSVGN